MAVKAINNSAKLNRIIPTLLVFRAYPQITKINTLSLSITKRANTIYIATKEVHYLQAERQVKNTLTIKNGLNTISMLSLPILLEVYI
jgi:hypothetical protein